MATEPALKTKGTFSDDPTYDSLLWILADLAGEWRETKREEVVKRYHTVLKSLLDMGWNDTLDFELQLPPELMPAVYKERKKAKATF